jgi:hypothetical protein
MPTPDPKTDRISTYFKGSKPSSEIYDHTPTIEKLQQENFHLLQQLEERNTMDRHLHHDNVILQAKVNSLQRLVDQMTNDNHSLCAQLKHHKRANTKSSRQEASKANPSLLSKSSHIGKFIFVCSTTCKILGVGVMLGS